MRCGLAPTHAAGKWQEQGWNWGLQTPGLVLSPFCQGSDTSPSQVSCLLPAPRWLLFVKTKTFSWLFLIVQQDWDLPMGSGRTSRGDGLLGIFTPAVVSDRRGSVSPGGPAVLLPFQNLEGGQRCNTTPRCLRSLAVLAPWAIFTVLCSALPESKASDHPSANNFFFKKLPWSHFFIWNLLVHPYTRNSIYLRMKFFRGGCYYFKEKYRVGGSNKENH